MTHYRERVLEEIVGFLRPLGPLSSALDFGSGDGFFASQWCRNGLIRSITAVDVVERTASIVKPTIYDGVSLPYSDRQFELAYAVDVLHHCPNPARALDDMARCSSRYLLIKDHIYETSLGKLMLSLLDELGNRRFGIPSPYLYQQGWSWTNHLESQGWRRIAFQHPMRCHTGLLGFTTNRLQFVGLWERAAA